MNDMDETEEIITDLIGADCCSIVIKMLYPKCFVCKKFEYEEFSLELYDDTWICGGCYLEEEYYTCNKCKKIYPTTIFNWCSLCFNNCSLYCPKHLSDKYKVIYDGDVDIIMDVLDGILDLIADNTTFDNRYY